MAVGNRSEGSELRLPENAGSLVYHRCAKRKYPAPFRSLLARSFDGCHRWARRVRGTGSPPTPSTPRGISTRGAVMSQLALPPETAAVAVVAPAQRGTGASPAPSLLMEAMVAKGSNCSTTRPQEVRGEREGKGGLCFNDNTTLVVGNSKDRLIIGPS